MRRRMFGRNGQILPRSMRNVRTSGGNTSRAASASGGSSGNS